MAPLPDDDTQQLFEVASRLREQRPSADDETLDRVWRRASARAGDRRSTARFRRVAILTLAMGGLLTGGSGALAISGLSSPGADAAGVVYPEDAGGGVQGTTEEGQETTATLEDDGAVLGSVQSGDEDGIQATEQAGATGESDDLPFTGLAAIPLLLLGAAMLVGGALLLRRLQHSSPER